jgi:hypothetical protein
MNSSLRSKRRTECESQSVPTRGRNWRSFAAAQKTEVNSRRQPAKAKKATSNETKFRADVPMISLSSGFDTLAQRVEHLQPSKSITKKQNQVLAILAAVAGPCWPTGPGVLD